MNVQLNTGYVVSVTPITTGYYIDNNVPKIYAASDIDFVCPWADSMGDIVYSNYIDTICFGLSLCPRKNLRFKICTKGE